MSEGVRTYLHGTDRAVETNTTYYYSTKPPPPRKPHQDSCQMSLAASVSASAYAAMCSRVLDMKIAEVQSILEDDPDCAHCAPLQRKLEQLIQQRCHRDESLQKVSYKLVLTLDACYLCNVYQFDIKTSLV